MLNADFAALAIGIVLFSVILSWREVKAAPFHRLGISPGPFGFRKAAAKSEFLTDGHRLVQKGYQLVSLPYACYFIDFLLIYLIQGQHLPSSDPRHGAPRNPAQISP